MAKHYYMNAGLLALLGNPIIVSVAVFILISIHNDVFVLLVYSLPVLMIPLVWIMFIRYHTRRAILPEKLYQILLPIFISFAYYMLVWVLLFGIYDDFEFNRILLFMILTVPYLGLNGGLAFADADPIWFPFVYVIVMLLALVPILIEHRRNQKMQSSIHAQNKAIKHV